MDETGSCKGISRREWLRLAFAAGVFGMKGHATASLAPMRRPIPRSGEMLPVIGLGTYQAFDVGRSNSQRAPLFEVLREFVNRGGGVVDSSPMYGKSESVLGDLSVKLDVQKQLFVATKVWTEGREAGVRQMEESFRRLRVARVDLMQVHNLVDWRTQLATLRHWREQGRVRYLGVTHYTESAYDELARVLQTEEIDFVQLNYSIVEREAEQRILPLAAERRIAVIANRPFAQAALFSKVRGRALPPWAAETGCTSWAQFFLKFVISHPAVTCAIPATSKVKHLADNMQAGTGSLPDITMRERMARHLTSI